jgi:hypothetical protein
VLFQSLASELISSRIQSDPSEEIHKTARYFSLIRLGVYAVKKKKLALSDLNNDLPGLDRLLKQKKNANKVVV